MHPSGEFELLIIQTLSASVPTEGKQRSEKTGGAGGSFITSTEEIHCRAARREENGYEISRALNEKKQSPIRQIPKLQNIKEITVTCISEHLEMKISRTVVQ